MRHRVLLLAPLALTMTLTGCKLTVTTPSMHPLYAAKDSVIDSALAGVWAEKDSKDTWKFFAKPSEKAYTLIYTEDKVVAHFTAHLVRIGDEIYMDTSLNELEDAKINTLYLQHLIAGHVFSRVKVKGDCLTIAVLDSDLLKEQVEGKKLSITHEVVEGRDDPDENKIVLTASTPELQEFVRKYGDEVFSKEPMELRRLQASAGAKAKSPHK